MKLHEASHVIQGQSVTPGVTPILVASSQMPVYNASNRQPPLKSTNRLHAQTRIPDHTAGRITGLSSRAVVNKKNKNHSYGTENVKTWFFDNVWLDFDIL